MASLSLFDQLWNESPMVKKMKEESEARGVAIGEARGKAEGALQVSREILINLVKARFPSLADLAQQKAAQMSNVGAIEHLIELIGTASDEHMACWLLSPTVA